jgi:hypothetical protein
MIADAFLGLINSMLSTTYGNLPFFDSTAAVVGNVPGDTSQYPNLLGGGSGGQSALQAVMQILWELNVFLPIDHMVRITTIGFTIVLCQWALNLIRWLIGTIRGSGTGTGAPA